MSYSLSQNYPNPFNPSTTIKFSLPEKAQVSIIIYNQLGQKVTELLRADKEAGDYQIEWNASNLPSGVYMYEMRTEKFSSIKKLILMK
ncbi:MAG: T9SS type A sorting domain-containing protein [Ignavibacteriales bacterium]|nr:T9SS type A sorting domain-containing protein [Ignavibacteriales bacterium]